ncbi:transposase [Mycolicibacterium fortuitum subsp. acetamidolyticum]|uniref:Transposase n=1 Tax=Mycolicibacterium fortuitum subsp. acetamidolyticum TaxID=144550 RepID=A0A117IDG3_MYCFO|nr:IS200/IS605 family element transposase accessory protein TnpB [Mycolicibacterium fortuitum]MCV7137861.1 IS200/IS605 family element transposase accessory protein TnpB [Mycolicibacterium fortuitum]GAT00940.1 transposase [Mycolicibacterium fortuitum subsp. acetamidolyticum]
MSITTRLRTSADDEFVLDQVAAHLGGLRRADLATTAHRPMLDTQLSAEQRRQIRRAELNARKKMLTAQSSARWANAIIAGNDDQYRLARDAQHRHIVGLHAAIATIENRLAAPTVDTLTVSERKARRNTRSARGYTTQAERFTKQQRLQRLRAELARVQADHADRRVRVTEGGKRLAHTRHHLDAAGMSLDGWRQKWAAARYRIVAHGSPDEPFGNLTITVTPAGEVSMRLPKPLEHLANAARSRYVLSCPAVFYHRSDEWQQRIGGRNSISYTITRRPGRAGRYLTAAWAIPALPYWVGRDDTAAGEAMHATGPVVGVDLNDGHLAVRRLDAHGNPIGAATRIDIDLTGSSARRDAQVRHAITQLIVYAQRFRITTIAVEDLDFADARTLGRETMGRGARGKRFRRTVSGIPTAVFRHRLTGMCQRAGIAVFAVNPAYSSIWGAQHWQHPYENVTRHQAAATVIGRRAQGYSARRRKGVTPTRPEDRAVRATNQTEPTSPTAITGNRHQSRMRGTTSRSPCRNERGDPGRATVTPALANNGQLQM